MQRIARDLKRENDSREEEIDNIYKKIDFYKSKQKLFEEETVERLNKMESVLNSTKAIVVGAILTFITQVATPVMHEKLLKKPTTVKQASVERVLSDYHYIA